ncbi:uncharacterized protein N7498_007824 [Penicillium cinerascens]|uniref:Xylanolytic transcriptional activator regulatory domain-containing protein n=1 Tax=Penicillium cinerascens TaxID=70096 RepID=A0A9W9JLN4_9EURO|nr:uncharacterized protein N7498_007824 [Penicillium cinerascens]KAJ5198707.1 hypothetical protein N7498_007824 [Penicillium cinerascens]
MASPSCQIQLYYGPTSHFSLMQHVYRDLVSHPTAQTEPSGGVDEAGAGLDLFSFRRIFFGTPDTQEGVKTSSWGDASVMFLPYELAKLFLSRFLMALYHMLPHRPKLWWEQRLEELYSPSPAIHPDTLTQALLLLALATGSLGTEYFAWGDVLLDRVKASLTSFDDVVNLQTVQISLLMISRPSRLTPPPAVVLTNQHTIFQNEQGRPNPAFLHLGSACRKAISAGLHKDVPRDDAQTPENIEERRMTFWSLYICETSLCLKDVAIEHPNDSFLRLLVQLCKAISRSTNEIYGEHHESLLHMWRVARSISDELRGFQSQMQHALGFGLDADVQNESIGVKQIIFTTSSTISAIQTVLRNISPTYEWIPDPKPDNKYSTETDGGTAVSHASGVAGRQPGILKENRFSSNTLFGSTSNLPPSQWTLPQFEGPETGRSGGSSEDLLDFTQSDMGWNFDFSTMDLEAFFSVYQSADASFS